MTATPLRNATRNTAAALCAAVFLAAALQSVRADESDGRFAHLWGSCGTPLHGSGYERIANIRNAAGRIDGMVLKPGETFSYNQTVGKRTYKAGFLPAPAIVYGDLTPVTGGGICQVSSTLYNAVLLSGLKIVERHRHHTPVNYLPIGLDATISWGSKDFRFQNSSSIPLRLSATVSEDLLTFEIRGEKPLDKEYRLETEMEEAPSPFGAEESLPALEIAVYRVRIEDGRVRSREYLYRDFYPARRIIREDPDQ